MNVLRRSFIEMVVSTCFYILERKGRSDGVVMMLISQIMRKIQSVNNFNCTVYMQVFYHEKVVLLVKTYSSKVELL